MGDEEQLSELIEKDDEGTKSAQHGKWEMVRYRNNSPGEISVVESRF